MKYQTKYRKTYNAPKADDSAYISKQSAIIPQPQVEIVNSGPSYGVLHNARYSGAEDKQNNGMILYRFHRINAKRSDAVNRQPWTVENASVAKSTLCDPVKKFFIDPPNKASGEKNQKQITQAVKIYFLFDIRTILHDYSFFKICSFERRNIRKYPL